MEYKNKILVAKPILKDPFFSKSIIYITNYDQYEGTLGFILNKKSDKTLRDIFPDIDFNYELYLGGPVDQDKIFILHSKPDLITNSIPVNNSNSLYYWESDIEEVKETINKGIIGNNEIRFFLGYSGWGSHQLEGEVWNKDWLIYENDFNIFQTKENLWEDTLIKIDKSYIWWVNAPDYPELN